MSELAAEAADLSSIPTEAGAARLRKLGLELTEVDERILMLDTELAAAKERYNTIVHKEMPDLMAEIRQDRIGLPDAYDGEGADLISSPYYKANIGADWEVDRRDAAFDYLGKIGAGDIVKNVVSLQFSRGSEKLSRAFLKVLDSEEFSDLLRMVVEPEVNDTSLPPVEVAKSVPWGTLTAFVKEQIEKGTVLDLPKIGATVGTVVKIKRRKAK